MYIQEKLFMFVSTADIMSQQKCIELFKLYENITK